MKRIVPVFLVLTLTFSFPVAANASTGDDGGLLGGLVEGIVDGLTSLFVPDDKFFEEHIEHMQKAIDAKTGGLATYFDNITKEFNQLQNSHQENSTLMLKMPDNLLFNGYKGKSVNMLSGIGDFTKWFRPLFSAFMVVTTIILCYRKLTGFFKE